MFFFNNRFKIFRFFSTLIFPLHLFILRSSCNYGRRCVKLFTESVNALKVTKANFAVMADGYLADQNDKLQVTSPDGLYYQVKNGETVIYNVFAKDLNMLTDGPVTLTFYPDLQYSEFNANWELTADVLVPEESGPSTT
jgi:hypothetical protein